MMIVQVALVSETTAASFSEVARVSAALQKQVARDVRPIWSIHATVDVFARLEDVPVGYWPIIIKDDIGDPSAAGYHEDKNGEPFSLVQYSDGWTLTASHELLEMLADPFGRRTVAGPSPKQSQGRVKFLVEVCDPCEADEFAYTVNGIKVSDFYTPKYFDPVTSGERYSFSGAVKEPRQVLKGGYLSWYHPPTKSWWQRTWFGGAKPSDTKLALKITNGNVRAAVDRHTELMRAKVQKRAVRRFGASATRLERMPVRAYVPEQNLAARAEELRAAVKRVSRGKRK